MRDLWLLPAGIEELLPAEAMRLERLRRVLTDLCYGWGYDLVSPPLIEHLDALLKSGGEDLDLETFKLVDHVSGRQLGVRADMTPQIARIDAHVLASEAPTRLCYAGPVLRARTRQAFDSREQFQVGAELYGASHADADAEVVELMMNCISACGFDRPHLDIGHVGVFRAIAREANLGREVEAVLFDALQRKSIPDLESIVASLSLPGDLSRVLVSLPALRGPADELDGAIETLVNAGPAVAAAVENMQTVIGALRARLEGVEIYFDLSELRGYHYHTGVVFSAFVEGHGREIARGGRYDDVGAVFGRSRPATGFSLDLRQVIKFDGVERLSTGSGCVFAPASNGDGELEAAVHRLRAEGERVVRSLGNGDMAAPTGCDRALVEEEGIWRVVPMTSNR